MASSTTSSASSCVSSLVPGCSTLMSFTNTSASSYVSTLMFTHPTMYWVRSNSTLIRVNSCLMETTFCLIYWSLKAGYVTSDGQKLMIGEDKHNLERQAPDPSLGKGRQPCSEWHSCVTGLKQQVTLLSAPGG
jgi:hypothetical protein